jgi:hypothetical protein
VRAARDDATAVEQQDLVRHGQRAEAVGDNDDPPRVVQQVRDQGVGTFRVEVLGRLVDEQERRR